MQFRALPGFRDFFPEEMAVRRHIESAWHAAARAAGFEEIEGPPLESLDLLKAKSGEAIVEEIYAFVDKGGRDVAMRAELTPTVARMVAEKAASLRKPVKWYAVPQLFRYQRQQRGRLREHIQWNVDVFGSSEIGADAEVLAVGLDALRRLGVTSKHVCVRVSHKALVSEKLGDREDLETVLRLIDKGALDAQRAAELGVDDAFLKWLDEPMTDERVSKFLSACDDYGVGDYMVPDKRIVRGLAYYTGIVYEVFDRSGTLRAVAGGGRYDGLVEKLGGPAMPALGFGMGDVVLGNLLKDLDLLPDTPARVDIIVAPLAEARVADARRRVRELRDADESAEAPYAACKRNAAFKIAKAAKARRMVLLHEDGEEETVDL